MRLMALWAVLMGEKIKKSFNAFDSKDFGVK
jgi:hypothetical protein